jgi:hypothetical protein
LAELPNEVAARAAVPGSGARPFGTRPFRSVPARPAVVPFPRRGPRQDRRKPDLACIFACYVPIPLIMGQSMRGGDA